ncbi:MAG: hypothetical protein KC561_20300, partial [Myxococcales bacterium]|nr:hypothetical protein [Myxococcales bacterium]
SADGFRLRFSYLATTAEVLESDGGGAVLLFVGRPNQFASLRQHFFRRDCIFVMPVIQHPAVGSMQMEYCHGLLHPLPEGTRDTSAVRGTDREVMMLLRLEADLNPLNTDESLLQRLNDRSPSEMIHGHVSISRAMRAALRDELPAALDYLDQARAQLTDPRFGSGPSLTAIEAMGQGLYERLMRGAQSNPTAMSHYFARYSRHQAPDIAPQVAVSLAQALRESDNAEAATNIYLDLLDRNEGDEAMLMYELAQAYYESGDLFRSYETTQFLNEQYPGFHSAQRMLQQVQVSLREEGERQTQARTCGGQLDPDVVEDLILLIGCAREAGDYDSAIRFSNRLSRLDGPDQQDVSLHQIGELWAQTLTWEREHAANP